MELFNIQESQKEKYRNHYETLNIVLLEEKQQFENLHDGLNTDNSRPMMIVTVSDIDSLLNTVISNIPDIVILNDVSSEIDWFKIITSIKKINKDCKIIFASSCLERKFIIKIMRTGASGYVVDIANSTDLLQALDVVSSGGVYLSKEILSGSDQDPKISSMVDKNTSLLSKRECEVVRLIGDGFSTKEIAFELEIGIKTVETYRTRVMDKLDIFSIAGLTKFAISVGLTKL